MPPVVTCKQLAAGIRLLKRRIPDDEAKLAEAQNLLSQLIDEGVTGPPLDKFKELVAEWQRIVENDQTQLETFKEDYRFQDCGDPELIH
jgi:hypothetical protein